MRVLFLGLFLVARMMYAQSPVPEKWLTPYEKSGCLETPDYDETMRYCRMLAAASPWIRIADFGMTPRGRALPLILLSKDARLTPEQARTSRKPLLLIQSGIHAGEIDGKDASLMLMRDICVTKRFAHLLDRMNILLMPIFNLDGHERRSLYNRINQAGPRETGWRVTANNLNLNRDYMKADAPEMRAWLAAFHAWKPDMFVDCHVTDGMDFQYDVTYAMEMFANAPPAVVSWQKDLESFIVPAVEKSGHLIAPFIWPREEHDLTQGFATGAATPRFSTGYAALQNRGAMLIETHSLKNYRTRVEGTYHLLKAIMEFIHRDPDALREAVRRSDKETAESFAAGKVPPYIPLQFKTTEKQFSTILFRGYRSETAVSAVTGREFKRWTRDTLNVTAPLYAEVIPSDSVLPPRCYLIPREWRNVIDLLRLHDVRLERLKEDVTIPVEMYRFSNAKWRETPYEGRHTVNYRTETERQERTFPAGTYVVRLGQASAKAAIHLLEPRGPDAFVQWGFFDAVFERKEYYEGYIMEEIAKGMLERDASLRAEFERKISADSSFAKNPRARMEYFYDHSPYADREWNLYPIARYLSEKPLLTIPENEKRATRR